MRRFPAARGWAAAARGWVAARGWAAAKGWAAMEGRRARNEMASSKQASCHSPCERPRRAGRRPSPRTPACHTRARCGAAGPGALQLCVLWRCGAQPEGRTAATPRHGPWWPSRSLLSELACREVGHSVVEHGHALVVCGVERYFCIVVPGWSKYTSLGECDQSAAAASLWHSRGEGTLPWPRQPGASDRAS